MTDNADNVAKLPQRVPVSAGAFPKAIVPADMDEAWRIAKLIVASGLAPRDVQTPERAMVAIMTGLELGLPPMTAIQRIAVINGRPCIWGDAVPALAQRTGMLEKWDEGITGEGDDMVAHCTVTRRINAETTITKTATFSVADAKKASLWTTAAKVERKARDGSKYIKDNDSPWYRFPKRMLQMRARVAFRDLFADAMCGLYIAEEMVSGNSDAEMRDVTPQHETIHNPLQDDADVEQPSRQEARSYSEREIERSQNNIKEMFNAAGMDLDAGTEMEVMPPEPHHRDIPTSDTSPPGASQERLRPGGSQKTPLDYDPVTGEVFDSPATLTNPANEITDPSPEELASARATAVRGGYQAPEGPRPEPQKTGPAKPRQKAPLDYDPVTGEVFDAKVDSERRDAEASSSVFDPPINVRTDGWKTWDVATGEVLDPPPAAKPPSQARRKAQDEPKPSEAAKDTPDEKSSPGPNPALGIALEQPWIKRTPADYISYLWKWTEAWARWGQNPIGLRDRFSAERTIRNGLGSKMDAKQLAECNAIAAGAFSRLGGQLK